MLKTDFKKKYTQTNSLKLSYNLLRFHSIYCFGSWIKSFDFRSFFNNFKHVLIQLSNLYYLLSDFILVKTLNMMRWICTKCIYTLFVFLLTFV